MNPYFLFFFFVATLSSILPKPPPLTYIVINLEQTSIDVFDAYWSLNIPCEARVGQCTFQYTLLPSGWSYVGNKINIPLEDTKKTVNYVVNTKIFDPTGEQVEKSFIVEMDAGTIHVLEQ